MILQAAHASTRLAGKYECKSFDDSAWGSGYVPVLIQGLQTASFFQLQGFGFSPCNMIRLLPLQSFGFGHSKGFGSCHCKVLDSAIAKVAAIALAKQFSPLKLPDDPAANCAGQFIISHIQPPDTSVQHRGETNPEDVGDHQVSGRRPDPIEQTGGEHDERQKHQDLRECESRHLQAKKEK